MQSLIFSIDQCVGSEILDAVISHYIEEPDLEIIISSIGPLECPYSGNIISSPKRDIFNLSESRNQGAKLATTDRLIFCDIDTLVDIHKIPNNPIVRGVWRCDFMSGIIGKKYKCACSPLAIDKQLFIDLGGYSELYGGWGYEDSDFEHKWPYPAVDVDAEARHIGWIHYKVSSKPTWGRGLDKNRDLFDTRMKLSKEERIKTDREFLNKKYGL